MSDDGFPPDELAPRRAKKAEAAAEARRAKSVAESRARQGARQTWPLYCQAGGCGKILDRSKDQPDSILWFVSTGIPVVVLCPRHAPPIT